MRRLVLAMMLLVLGAAALFGAGDDQKGAPPPCVILKRMGPADQVTSHFYSWGIRGKQFQYIEGQLPKDVKFHGRLTDHDVRAIQEAGGKVEIVDSHYTTQELQDARKSCSEDAAPAAGKSEAPPPPPPLPPFPSTPGAPPAPAVPPAPPAPAAALVSVAVKSEPDGADITADGKFVGSTPSTLRLAAGDHVIVIEKSGYKAWKRTMTIASGESPTISATLDKN
jgi:PEGA domain